MKTTEPMKLRVLLAILYFPVMVFLQTGRDIIAAMTGNANYLTPFPTLTDVTAALDDLQAKIEAAAGGGPMATSARNTSWNTAKMLFRQLAGYIQAHCQNDLTILLSSGFKATKTPSPIGPLASPENLRTAYTGTSGQIILYMNVVYGVTAGYTVQQAEAEAGPYVMIANHNKTELLVAGLTPGKTYYFRACANGAAGPSGWSNSVSVMAV